MQQRLNKDSLAILQPDLPSFLASSETGVWRRLTQGAAHSFLGEFAQAEKSLAEADLLAEENHPDLLGEVMLRKGTLTDIRGDSKTAAELYRQALEFARKAKDSYLEAAALGSLGFVATEEEHYDESIGWDEAALKASESAGAQRSFTKTLVNMGWSYIEIGDYMQALSLFQRADEFSGKAELLSEQAICRVNIGTVNYYTHDYTAAEKASQEALELARRLDEKSVIAESLDALSLVALARGAIDLAEIYNKQAHAVSVSANDRPGELSSALIDGRIASARGHYAEAESYLKKIIDDAAAETSLRWEAEARLAKIYADEGQPVKAQAEFARSIQTIEVARSSVSSYELRLAFLSSAIEFYDDYIDFLISQNKPNDALKIAELSRSQTLAEGLAPSSPASKLSPLHLQPQQIAKSLNVSLLFYWVGHNRSYLWVINPTNTKRFDLPKSSIIDPLVKSYRKALLEMRDVEDTGSSDGRQLYAMLVEPAQKLLPSGSRVILLPAESLYVLNFETLIVSGPQPHFWIEDVTLTTANSLSLLASTTRRPIPKEKSLFLVGDTEPPNPSFPRLPQVREEMKEVKKYFRESQTKVLEGMQATPAAYLSSNPERYSYVHFVTHGTASRTRPLESAVILSNAGASYKLYARDIVQHHLNANLVTISACNGSGTQTFSGEGLVGLSWAFLRAGAHNVIGALWEVSAASTPQLMDAFYGGLFRNEDSAAALRAAKLKLLHSSDPQSVFKKPFYWAPFQLYAGS